MCVANWIHLKFIWNSFDGGGGRKRREEEEGGEEGREGGGKEERVASFGAGTRELLENWWLPAECFPSCITDIRNSNVRETTWRFAFDRIPYDTDNTDLICIFIFIRLPIHVSINNPRYAIASIWIQTRALFLLLFLIFLTGNLSFMWAILMENSKKLTLKSTFKEFLKIQSDRRHQKSKWL